SQYTHPGVQAEGLPGDPQGGIAVEVRAGTRNILFSADAPERILRVPLPLRASSAAAPAADWPSSSRAPASRAGAVAGLSLGLSHVPRFLPFSPGGAPAQHTTQSDT